MTLTSTPQLSYADNIEDIKLLQDAMRHIFQRAMAEPDEEIQQIIKKVGFSYIIVLFGYFLNYCLNNF